MKRKPFLLMSFFIFILFNPIFAHAWIQVNQDGFGSSNNESIRAMAKYSTNNRLYAGTVNQITGGTQVWEYDGIQPWTQVSTPWDPSNLAVYSMAEFNGLLYMGTYSEAVAEIWTYDGSTPWNQLTPGWDAGNQGTANMAIDNGNNILYVGTYNEDAEGGEVWQYNGTSWAEITPPTPTWDADNIVARQLIFHNGILYVGTVNTTDGAEVWKYDPAGPGWTRIAVAGFGNPNNTGIYGLFEYSGNIYAGTENKIEGGEVWEYDTGLESWTQITPTWDANNTTARVMTVFENCLYVGLMNVAEGIQIWAYDGSDWKQKVVDGFGDTNNYSPPSMAEYNGLLYVGTTNTHTGTEVWKFSPVFTIPPVLMLLLNF